LKDIVILSLFEAIMKISEVKNTQLSKKLPMSLLLIYEDVFGMGI